MMELADRPLRIPSEPFWLHLWRLVRWVFNLRLVPRWQESQPDLLSRLIRPWLVEGLTRYGRLLLLLLPVLLLLNVRREGPFPLGIPAFLASLLFVSALVGRFYRPRIELVRHPVGHAVAGEPWSCKLRLTNIGGRSAYDLTVRETRGARVRWPRSWEQSALASLSPGKSAELESCGTPTARGYMQLTGLTVESQYPFLLTRSNVLLPAPLSVPVLPASWQGELPHLSSLMKHAAPRRGSRRAGDRSGQVEYVDSRPFQLGDSVRRLDQRASARRGEPMTRVFQGTASSEKRRWWVIFDQSLIGFAPWQPRPRKSQTLDRRLALLYEMVRRGQGEGLGYLAIWMDGHWQSCKSQSELTKLVVGCTASNQFQPPPELPDESGGLSLFVTGCWDRSRAELVDRWRADGVALAVVMVPENSACIGSLPIEPGSLELQG